MPIELVLGVYWGVMEIIEKNGGRRDYRDYVGIIGI